MAGAAIAIALRPLPQLRCNTEPGSRSAIRATKRGVARDAATVLAGLVWRADDDILRSCRREAAIGDDPGDDPGEHVVGPQPGERAGMASNGLRPTGIEISVEHGAAPS